MRENETKLSDWRIPVTSLAEVLKSGVLLPLEKRRLKITGQDKLISTFKALPTMYAQLSSLARGDHKGGAFGIANAILFLWKDHFASNPLYRQVTSILFLRGSEQHYWFNDEANDAPTAEQALSKLRLNDCEPQSWISLPFELPDAKYINKQVVDCVSRALSGLEAAPVSERARIDSKQYVELENLVENQNTIMIDGIRKSTLAQLHGALRVCELVEKCGTLAKIFKLEDYFKSSDESKVEHLRMLLENLEELRIMWK